MKTSKHVLLSLVLCCAIFKSFSQPNFIHETFDTIPYLSSTSWNFDSLKFQQTDGKLRSKSSTVNDRFYLSHLLKYSQDYEFAIDISLPFATSSGNFVDLYLSSNEANIQNSDSALFLRIGDTKDEFKLVNRLGNDDFVLSRSTEKITHSFNGSVQILCLSEGLIVSVTHTNNTILWRDTLTPIHLTPKFFIGLSVQQSTKSFHEKHTFDNWYVGPIRRDTVPPKITRFRLNQDSTVEIVFNENVDTNSFEKTSCRVVGLQKAPSLIHVSGDSVKLKFNHHFETGQYKFHVDGIQDLEGNKMLDSIFEIEFIEISTANTGDIILTEIMCDPSPNVSLPEYEYVEIVNRSSKTFDLLGWKLNDASKYCELPAYIFHPDSFLILCDKSHVKYFQSFGSVLGISNFVSLNNSSDSLRLYGNTGTLLDYAYYSSDWHTDEWKQEGGWSLEIQNRNSPCDIPGNWVSSRSETGGTPGYSNSVESDFSDTKPPSILKSEITNSEVRLIFDESILTYTPNSEDVTCVLRVDEINILSRNTLQIIFKEPLEIGKAYELHLRNIHDCSHNSVTDTTIIFGLTTRPTNGDIVINELMFDPMIDGVEYIEIYNSRDALLNVQDLYIGKCNSDGTWETLEPVIAETSFVKPHGLIVLTNHCKQLKKRFPNMVMKNCIDTDNLDQLANQEGAIGVALYDGTPLDQLFYSKNLHFELLTETKGVSIERRSYIDSTNLETNWTSASANSGYGTPGSINSQHIGLQKDNLTRLRFDPISPNGDGYHDVLILDNRQIEPNAIVDLQIFDLAGRLVAYPINKQIVGYSNHFTWEMIDDSGAIVYDGIYIVQLKTFTPKNGEKIFRAPFTVAF